MKKSMLFAAAAVVAMASCTNEDFTGFQQVKNGESAINFGSGTKKLTRAENIEGADAAVLLDNNFVVLGIKSDGDLTAGQTVFDYYNVNYYDGTANQTESNSANWEYVGQSVSEFATAKAQTIKYWDFAKSQYDFIAFSKGANEETIENLFSTVDLSNLATKAYTITGTLDQLKNCFVADLLTYYNSTTSSDFNQTVKPVFRRMQAKLRLGFYETVPGYSVKDVKFYTDAAATSSPTPAPALFASAKTLFIGGDAKGAMTVSFPVTGSSNVGKEGYNVANIKFAAATGAEGSSYVTFDELVPTKAELYEDATAEIYLGRTSNTATYAGDNILANDYAYKTILPVGDGGQVLNLKVDYTLVAIDGSGEEINVKGATAQIPAIYTNWQPNYAYTYLFKISDQTNGVTNPDQPGYVGLYPITFDACVMSDVDGIQETITEVGKNAITTYQSKKVVTENDEYKAGKNIYVTVNNGEVLTDDYWAVGAVNVFKAEIDNDALQTISEASVANCIEQNYDPTNTYATCQVTDANRATLKLTKLTTGWELLDAIPADDAPHGVKIETDGSNTCVAQITEPEAGTYVFQYLETAATYKDAPFNTIAQGGTFWTLVKAPTAKGYTYTYTQTTPAAGTEAWAADTYYRTAPNLGTAIVSPKTLTAGKIYYEFDETTNTYTQFVAVGNEPWNAKYYGFDVKPALCYGNLTDNKIPNGGTYFVRDGNKYKAVVADADIVVKATDKYYYFGSTDNTVSAYTLVAVAEDADNANTLAKGTTYYKYLSSGDGYEEFVSDGTETWADATYFASVGIPAAAFAEEDFNTLATGSTYFINTDNEPEAKEADGTETKSGAEKVVDKMPTYYYKVIKVVE